MICFFFIPRRFSGARPKTAPCPLSSPLVSAPPVRLTVLPNEPDRQRSVAHPPRLTAPAEQHGWEAWQCSTLALGDRRKTMPLLRAHIDGLLLEAPSLQSHLTTGTSIVGPWSTGLGDGGVSAAANDAGSFCSRRATSAAQLMEGTRVELLPWAE
jgi:hypothetical protein